MVGVGVGVMVAVGAVVVGMADADSLDVMVVAALGEAHLVLEAQHLFAVFAQLAVHHVGAV